MNILRLTIATLFLVPALAHAGADCVAHPKAKWMNMSDLRTKLEADGYKIKKLKIDGHCYEMYGTHKDGRRFEIYMDTVTGKPVKTITK